MSNLLETVVFMFYVIYSFDWREETDPEPDCDINGVPVAFGGESRFLPDKEVLDKLECTEDDDCADFEDMYPHHRKYCGILTQEEFDKFIESTGLVAEDVETMGSLTLEFGHLPAISFNAGYDALGYVNAYVSPLPQNKKELDWENVRKVFTEKYQ